MDTETSAFTGKDAEQQKIQFLVDKIASRLGKTDGNKQKRIESWPIATLNSDAQVWLGTDSNIVYFSTETAIKQIVKRGENIGVDQYIKVQSLLDNAPVVVKDRDLHLAYFKEDGKYYKAVVKLSTNSKDQEELYLVSMHEVQPSDIEKAKKKGRVVRDLL